MAMPPQRGIARVPGADTHGRAGWWGCPASARSALAAAVPYGCLRGYHHRSPLLRVVAFTQSWQCPLKDTTKSMQAYFSCPRGQHVSMAAQQPVRGLDTCMQVQVDLCSAQAGAPGTQRSCNVPVLYRRAHASGLPSRVTTWCMKKVAWRPTPQARQVSTTPGGREGYMSLPARGACREQPPDVAGLCRACYGVVAV